MTIKKKFKKSTKKNLAIGSRPDALTRYMSEISKIKFHDFFWTFVLKTQTNSE